MKNNSDKKSDELKLRKLLESIYNEYNSEQINLIFNQLIQKLNEFNLKSLLNNKKYTNKGTSWDQSHSVLITYADSIYKKGEPTLRTLHDLSIKYFNNLSSVLHILPFLKSTSDGGFAVSSYTSLDERFGNWNDLKTLSDNHILMADLVLNHVSSSHPWVQQFIKNQEPGLSNIYAPLKDLNWDNVVRPRNSSLFSQINTSDGPKLVWTTFGPDQIDLNWENPKIIIEFLSLVISYVECGIKWLRLDAVGFIWKESGTTCLHLPKAHSIVKVLRILLTKLSVDSVLITETNVPQDENISYLTSNDEAHMAYNFPLPPLILEAVITSRADILNNWINDWPDLPESTTFFNFTASHDGVGLRALEGLMGEERIKQLLIDCEKRGGLVSHRRLSNGEDKPYELNISWWSAMEDSGRETSRFQYERFILSQLIVIALKGVPAFYLPAILASANDIKSFSKTGQRRDLNREKFEFEKLLLILKNEDSSAFKNIKFLSNAMKIRSDLKAFHPASTMLSFSKNRSDVVAIKRGNGKDSIFAIHNLTENKLNFSINEFNFPVLINKNSFFKDYLTGKKYNDLSFVLKPFQVIWIGI